MAGTDPMERFAALLQLLLLLASQLPKMKSCQICGVEVDGRRVCERCYWDGALK